MEAKLIQIGNSKGIRLPKRLITKYGFAETVALKEVEAGILIESSQDAKLSWKDTFKAMAASDEDWSDWAALDLEDMDEDQ